ncbi:hypothetical protein Taro_018223 [Colocasia esculenta]|uniref:Transcription initiation factor TFIID component TAF4 C-terminal domain-containing protein n=1 Tax=Colocasia esculenta TaxID=4460 RepID=A0A843UQ60_COLES|nr:hypothetical protein [Colocasia esculenta]
MVDDMKPLTYAESQSQEVYSGLLGQSRHSRSVPYTASSPVSKWIAKSGQRRTLYVLQPNCPTSTSLLSLAQIAERLEGNSCGCTEPEGHPLLLYHTGGRLPLIRSQIPSATLPIAAGTGMKTPPKKPSVGQKKPFESQGTPPPASKKQKVSGAYHDQSIEQLNDVTAVSGEEEEQLLSAPKEESRASEATHRVVQEEEGRMILLKGPLRKKLVEIMSKCGVKNMNSDVERCLSLLMYSSVAFPWLRIDSKFLTCVEERLRGFISNLIRISRQRVDIEKARRRIIFTSDVRRQISMINKREKEEWERKQAEEIEKLRKQNEAKRLWPSRHVSSASANLLPNTFQLLNAQGSHRQFPNTAQAARTGFTLTKQIRWLLLKPVIAKVPEHRAPHDHIEHRTAVPNGKAGNGCIASGNASGHRTYGPATEQAACSVPPDQEGQGSSSPPSSGYYGSTARAPRSREALTAGALNGCLNE